MKNSFKFLCKGINLNALCRNLKCNYQQKANQNISMLTEKTQFLPIHKTMYSLVTAFIEDVTQIKRDDMSKKL